MRNRLPKGGTVLTFTADSTSERWDAFDPHSRIASPSAVGAAQFSPVRKDWEINPEGPGNKRAKRPPYAQPHPRVSSGRTFRPPGLSQRTALTFLTDFFAPSSAARRFATRKRFVHSSRYAPTARAAPPARVVGRTLCLRRFTSAHRANLSRRFFRPCPRRAPSLEFKFYPQAPLRDSAYPYFHE